MAAPADLAIVTPVADRLRRQWARRSLAELCRQAAQVDVICPRTSLITRSWALGDAFDRGNPLYYEV